MKSMPKAPFTPVQVCSAILICSALSLICAVGYLMQRERIFLEPKRTSPDMGAVPWESVTIAAMDGVKLRGSYKKSRNGVTVILLHGHGGNRAELLWEAELLQSNGFGVLAYDSRAHGESEGRIAGYGDNEANDLRDVVNWLINERSVDSRRIGAFAFSVGGLALIKYASVNAGIASLAIAGTPTSMLDLARDEGGTFSFITAPIKMWGVALADGGGSIQALDEIKKISTQPILFVYGDKDKTVPLERGFQLYDSARTKKQMAIFYGAGHGRYFENDPSRYAQLLLGHFRDL